MEKHVEYFHLTLSYFIKSFLFFFIIAKISFIEHKKFAFPFSSAIFIKSFFLLLFHIKNIALSCSTKRVSERVNSCYSE